MLLLSATSAGLLPPHAHVLIDDSLIDVAKTNAVRTRHSVVKDPANPIISEDKPWENRLHMYGSVVDNGPDDIRIYYLGLAKTANSSYNCVAISKDGGSTFARPNLGLMPFEKSKKNNIIYTAPVVRSIATINWVGVNPTPDARPEHRFLATMTMPTFLRKTAPPNCSFDTHSYGIRYDALYIATSADGFDWKAGLEAMSPNCFLPAKDDTQNVILWDDKRSNVLAYNRVDNLPEPASRYPACGGVPKHEPNPPQREAAVASLASATIPPEPHKWPERKTVLNFDAPPKCTDIYSNGATRYEGAYVLMPVAYSHFDTDQPLPTGKVSAGDGTLETRLMASRDGLGPFSNVGGAADEDDAAAFIPRGHGTFNASAWRFEGAWDAGIAFVFAGWARVPSGATQRVPHTVGVGGACPGDSMPMSATALTRVAWRAACNEWQAIQLFYFGSQTTHTTQSEHFSGSQSGVGRAYLRRDGFAGLASAAVDASALVVTKPLAVPSAGDCAGSSASRVVLSVNVAVEAGGSACAGLSLPNGTVVPGFGLAQSDCLNGGHVRAPLSWRGDSEPWHVLGAAGLGGATEEVVLTVQLTGAELFAWEWSCVALLG